MDDSTSQLIKYCLQHSTTQGKVLYDLERETYLKTLAPQMMSGHLQGQLLSLLSKMLQPKAILEIGTFTGYSAICLAQGLAADGVLHTIEANQELAYIIRKYIERAALQDSIQLHIGDAKQLIPNLTEIFDIVFIDAGKNDNGFYYDLIFDQVRSGGLILIDNVLWSQKVLRANYDKDTQTIHAFNQKIQADERVENVLLPIRDGLTVVRKR